jgi:hypothetical protein
MSHQPQLHVATYHYVRDLPRTRFPRIKGMLLDDFRRQAKALPDVYEMATLESAIAFLTGKYSPRRDLCLMTFDDGLREHYADVTPILAEEEIQGLFFLISGCLEDGVVAPVHMNHFLMAHLGFDAYRPAFEKTVQELGHADKLEGRMDTAICQRTYPLDTQEIARFKYLFNFVLPPNIRDLAVKTLFERHLGGERAFGQELYLNWGEAREMQRAGMIMGRPYPRTPAPLDTPISRALPGPYQELGADSKELRFTGHLAFQLPLWESRFLQSEHSGNLAAIRLPHLALYGARKQLTGHRPVRDSAGGLQRYPSEGRLPGSVEFSWH